MRRRCLLRRRWPWLGLLLVPVLAWGGVLAMVPTGWARARLVDRLSKATGRSVQIGALRLGVLGDLRILDLSLAERSSPADPWLRVAEARIDVRLGQVLCGHCQPREVVVEGVELRLWRKADGTPEFGDLLRDRSDRPSGTSPGRAPAGPSAPLALVVSGASIRVVDEPSGTRMEILQAEARGTWGTRFASLDDLRGRLNGGTIAMAGKLDRDPATPRFEAEFHAEGVEVDRGMPALGLFVPVVAGATDGVGGKVNLFLALKGQGTTRLEFRRTLRGRGSVALDPVDLEGSRFLAQLDVLGDWPRESRIGSVAADFTVEGGRILTDDLTIRASRFPFVLGGWTDFDGRFDYEAKVDKIAARLPRDAKGWASDFRVNLDDLAGLRMTGSADRCEMTVNGHPLTGDPDRPDGERARFRDSARRIRDRFFR